MNSTYFKLHNYFNKNKFKWQNDKNYRKKYNNNYSLFIKQMENEIQSIIRSFEDKTICWNQNLEIINKEANLLVTKFIKFRALDQHGELVDVLQYLYRPKHFIYYPEDKDAPNYFDTIKDINDCHNIFVIENKIETSQKSKVVKISYSSRYIK